MEDRKIIEMIIEIEPMLHRIAKQHLRCREDQEDAVQECLCKAWKNRNTLRQQQYFRTWIVKILKNECVAICRKLKRKKNAFDMSNTAAQMDINQQLEYREMYRALENVHAESKTIIFLRFCGGYKYKEIAEMTGIPPGTVASRAHRSLKHVREALSA